MMSFKRITNVANARGGCRAFGDDKLQSDDWWIGFPIVLSVRGERFDESIERAFCRLVVNAYEARVATLLANRNARFFEKGTGTS